MKKVILMLVVIGLALIVMTPITKSPKQDNVEDKNPAPSVEIKPETNTGVVRESKSIFVPDWQLSAETILHNGYDRWIYFGSPEKQSLFFSSLDDKNLWATTKVNTIEQLEAATIDQFDTRLTGVVLDLEISGLANEEFVKRINHGVERFYAAAKQNNFRVALAMYGDLFYRKRPYDLKTLNNYSDEIMIMAYDFHKSYGEPGENYPYENFKDMVNDYLEHIPKEKITVIFGMYGYDWVLSDGKPLKPASVLTLAQIKSRFLKKCSMTNCKTVINEASQEKYITYTDEDGLEHFIYFEDEDSVSVKTDYLKTQGIGSISYWAWGYF